MGRPNNDLERTDGDSEHGGRPLPSADRQEIAARIRALFDDHPVSQVAYNLRVSIGALNDAIDPSMPVQPVDVLAAIAHAFGVDPTWLLIGEYDARTHHAAASSEEAAASVIRSILRRSV